MSREIVASAVLTAGQLPLLALHRHVPERSLPELLVASGKVTDPVRLALFHLQGGCAGCAAGGLCGRGVRLVEACHAWRPRETGR